MDGRREEVRWSLTSLSPWFRLSWATSVLYHVWCISAHCDGASEDNSPLFVRLLLTRAPLLVSASSSVPLLLLLLLPLPASAAAPLPLSAAAPPPTAAPAAGPPAGREERREK